MDLGGIDRAPRIDEGVENQLDFPDRIKRCYSRLQHAGSRGLQPGGFKLDNRDCAIEDRTIKYHLAQFNPTLKPYINVGIFAVWSDWPLPSAAHYCPVLPRECPLDTALRDYGNLCSPWARRT